MNDRAQVVIVDYGRGNLFSVRRAFEHMGAEVTTTDDPSLIAAAPRLVLPGVGAYGDAMTELTRRDLVEPLKSYAQSGRPMLGICVGMQVLFERGEEFGEHCGLGIISGSVIAIADCNNDGQKLKIPHIGWSALVTKNDSTGTILEGLEDGAYCYFVHSFAAQVDNGSDCLAETAYGDALLTAVVNRGSVWGCQFHPEKSGPIGLKIVSNFLNLPGAA